MKWNEEATPMFKRVLLIVLAVVVIALLLAVCNLNGDTPANAAPMATTLATPEPDMGVSFTVTPTLFSRASTEICYKWNFGPWENYDGFNRLRFGFGEDVIACTNAQGTRWHSLPDFQPYHYEGYWAFVSLSKNHSALGYYDLYLSTDWEWKWDTIAGDLLHRGRLLRCDLTAGNHTANCTLYS